jgi:CDP-4-dehydro-6-deoxyglucose reductase
MVASGRLAELYPGFRAEDSGAFERVARVREEAFGRRVQERLLPSQDVLAQRLFAQSRELADARAHLARYHALVVAVRERVAALAARGPVAALDEVARALDDGLGAVLASESADALAVMDDALKIVSAQVTVRPSGRVFYVEGRDTLLQAALKAGVALDYGCGNGSCGLCKARVVAGSVVRTMPCDYVLSEAERGQGHVLLCAHSAASSEIVIEALAAAGPRDLPEQQIAVRVRAVQKLGDDTLLLHVQTPRSARLRFLAGQSVTLHGGGDDARGTWPVASCPCDDRNLHFHVAREADDALAQRLFEGAIRPGDALTLVGPTGDFILASDERPLAFVACDTGFAPVRSLIEHAMAADANEAISLDWLALRRDGHYAANQCRAWAEALDDFRYAAHVARDPAAGAAAVVASMAGALTLAERDVYVAGPAAFVDVAVPALIAAGAIRERLFATTP